MCRPAVFAGVAVVLAACGGAVAPTDPPPAASSAPSPVPPPVPVPAATVEKKDPPDSGFCIEIDPDSFDRTCNADTDCMAAVSGNFCGGAQCMCPGSAINVDGKARYDILVASAASLAGPGSCFCPLLGVPHCDAGQCKM